jgi:hypothetical protein
MELLPALTLWVLSAIRLPAALDRRRSSLFRATVFAAAACTLYVPNVYNTVDPLLGGHNHVGLATLLLLLLGFWQFRTAIVLAIVADNERRRRRLLLGRAAIAAAGLAVSAGFFASRVDRTDQTLPLAYGDQPGMQLFLWTGSAFIIWVCVDIVMVCRRHRPTMKTSSFRAAFMLIGIGCTWFCLVLANRLLAGVLESSPSDNGATINLLNWLYAAGETLAVILVSLGLLLPRLGDVQRRLSLNLQARRMLLEITRIWRRMTADKRGVLLNPHGNPLLDLIRGNPESRLHRRVVEIRDAQMISPDTQLSPAERDLIDRVEKTLSHN